MLLFSCNEKCIYYLFSELYNCTILLLLVHLGLFQSCMFTIRSLGFLLVHTLDLSVCQSAIPVELLRLFFNDRFVIFYFKISKLM